MFGPAFLTFIGGRSFDWRRTNWGGYAHLAGLVKSVCLSGNVRITTAKEVGLTTWSSDFVRTVSAAMALLFG